MSSVPPGTGGGTDGEQARYAWRVFSVTCAGVLITALNTSTLEVALPAVVRGVDAGAGAAGWLLLSYLLATTVGVLVLGRLADVVGRRPSYLAGLVVFSLASLGSGVAPNVEVLLGLRGLAGLGAAAVIVNTTPLIIDAFPERLRTLGLGFNVTMVSAAQLGGPVVGGLLADALGWRAVFWVFAPLGLLAAAWAALTLRRMPQPGRSEKLDRTGALLSVAALATLVLSLSLGGTLGWTHPLVLGCAAASIALWPLFVLLQARHPDPLVDLRLFEDRASSLAYVAAFTMAMSRFSVVLLIAVYLQGARGETATAAGLQIVPVALGMLVAAPLAGRLNRTFPARVLSTAGLLLSASGLLVLAAVVSPTAPYWPIGAAMAAVGAGSGLFFPPNTDAIVGQVPEHRRGAANAVRTTIQNTGYVVGTALSLALVTGPLPAEEKRAAYAGTLGELPGSSLIVFTDAYVRVLVVLAAITLLGALASALRPGRRDPSSSHL